MSDTAQIRRSKWTNNWEPVNPYVQTTMQPFEYASDSSISHNDPTGLEVNPYLCVGYVQNVHWAGGEESSRLIRVKGVISECILEPDVGYISIKLGLRTVNGNGPIIDIDRCYNGANRGSYVDCRWKLNRKKGTFYMENFGISYYCKDVQGKSAMVYGLEWAKIEIGGVWYDQVKASQSPDFLANNCYIKGALGS